MKRKDFIYSFGSLAVYGFLASCSKHFLDLNPHTIILDDQVWNDSKMIDSVLANLYDRLPSDTGLVGNWRNMADYIDAMWSGQSNENGRNNIPEYPYNSWTLWAYDFIRDVNLAIDGLENKSKDLNESDIEGYISEFRFLRAYMYFEMVKRMGGIPIITQTLDYDFSGDPTPLQFPRDKEEDVYDFIADELDDIKDKLKNEGDNSRANKYTALALKSRAMLYAGSIAKFNNEMPAPIKLTGGEVGIPAARADDYFQKSLDASNEIINSNKYLLYNNNPDLGENFYEAVCNKTGNTEVIFVKDYSKDKKHVFSYDNIARGIREDNLSSSSVTPSLNLVEAYPYLDGSSGILKNRTSDGSDYIYYDNLEDIFLNKDKRLFGTIIYPGTSFKNLPVEIQAGVKVWDDAASSYKTIEGDQLGEDYSDGKLLTGTSGPHRSINEVSNTGFYLKKFIDTAPDSSSRGVQSQMWWVWFRLGEIYLNAAEAAFELSSSDKGTAAKYISKLRERAGYGPNSITADVVTRDLIRNEFRCELAFEDHYLWDIIRWRTAHEVFDGDTGNQADMVMALYPYRVINPNDSNKDGKYVFDKLVAPRFVTPRRFRMGNYYSAIDQSVLNNNPKIVKNPFH